MNIQNIGILSCCILPLLSACTSKSDSEKKSEKAKADQKAESNKADEKKIAGEEGYAGYFPDFNWHRPGFNHKYETVLVLRGIKSKKPQYTLNYNEYLRLGNQPGSIKGKVYIKRFAQSDSNKRMSRFRLGFFSEESFVRVDEKGIWWLQSPLHTEKLYLPFPSKLNQEWKHTWKNKRDTVESTGKASIIDSLTVNGQEYTQVLKIVNRDFYPEEHLKTTATRTIYRVKGIGMVKRVIDRQSGFIATTTLAKE